MQITFREWDDSVHAHREAAALGSDEVQVWIASMASGQEDMALYTRLLSQDERERAARFIANEPRRQFVFGRAELRKLLGACLHVEPVMPAFTYQPRGKPVLAPSALGGDIRFNISHSGSKVAVALARGREVGVDIEMIQQIDDWPLLAERIFSPRELCELYSLPNSQQSVAFFNGWTRKEAYLKATGEGLTNDLTAIEVTPAPGDKLELTVLPTGHYAAHQWAIRDIPLPPGFAGAVVFDLIRGDKMMTLKDKSWSHEIQRICSCPPSNAT